MDELTEINDYTIFKTLSKSSREYTFQVVEKGVKIKTEDYYKVMKLKVLDDPDTHTDVETDLDISKAFEHPNIATYDKYFFKQLEGKTWLALVRPFFKTNISETANFKKFTAIDHEIMSKLISALAYMHDRYSMVLTLKKSNIFVDSSGEIQITDLALPFLFDIDLANKDNNMKMCLYTPPEMKYQLVSINYKCDIWNLGVFLYEIIKKRHPFEADNTREVRKSVMKGIDKTELGDSQIEDVIKECLLVNPKQRPSLAKVKMAIEKLSKQKNIDFDEAEVRRASYGLSSPNQNRNSLVGTEKLDHSSGEDAPEEKKLQAEPQNADFLEILKPDDFTAVPDESIVYNQSYDTDASNTKTRYKCVNANQDAHEGAKINGVGILQNGLIVTSGNDKKIRFWNPMGNDLVAVINEKATVGQILTFPKTKQFYYTIGGCIKSFDYTTKEATVIYEGNSSITCVTRLVNDKHDTIIVGLKDGTVEFVNRLQGKIYLSKPFHPGASVVSVSAKNDILISAAKDNMIVVYNIKTTILEQELNMENGSFSNILGALKIGDSDTEMIIVDEGFGLSWNIFEIENRDQKFPDIGYKSIMGLFDFVSDNSSVFATCNEKGVIKMWERIESEDDNGKTVEVNNIRSFKGHREPISAITYFKDGSLVTASHDGSYRIWTSRKDVNIIGKVGAGQGGCCGAKCIIQ